MNMVKHSKCQKCKKISNESELIPNDKGIGKMCADIEACKNRTNKVT
jgi:hypothetical protein